MAPEAHSASRYGKHPWRAVVAVIAIIGALVAALLWNARPRAGGPLAVGSGGVVVNAYPAGSTVTYGLQTLGNDSPSAEIELVSVTVRIGEQAVGLLGEPELLGPERVEVMDIGSFDVLPNWPPEGAPATRPVAGAVIGPGERSTYEVVVPLRVPSIDERIGVIDGFVVEYTVDGRRYRELTDTVLVICPIEDHAACDAFDPTTDL